MYTIVTSLNQKYWDETSKINIQSWAQFLPPEVKIVIYSEDDIDIGNLKERIIVSNMDLSLYFGFRCDLENSVSFLLLDILIRPINFVLDNRNKFKIPTLLILVI